MDFFNSLSKISAQGEWTFKISKTSDDAFRVVVIFNNPYNSDMGAQHVNPMLFEGSAQELDNELFDHLTVAGKQADQLFVNMNAFMRSIETAKENSEMEKQLKNKATENKKKWDAIYEQIKAFSSKMEYEKAFALIPTDSSEFGELAQTIDKVKEEISFKKSQVTLF